MSSKIITTNAAPAMQDATNPTTIRAKCPHCHTTEEHTYVQNGLYECNICATYTPVADLEVVKDRLSQEARVDAVTYTEDEHEAYLNEFPLEGRAESEGGRIPDDEELGTWMRRHDRTAWNLSFQETAREIAFRANGWA